MRLSVGHGAPPADVRCGKSRPVAPHTGGPGRLQNKCELKRILIYFRAWQSSGSAGPN
jgi:hypothetical protein